MLPQKPQQFKWKGPPVPRAKPIPREQWDEHKKELTDLYDRMTIDELMVEMRIKHNFAPSRRQYSFQFEKWGLHKYRTGAIGSGSSLARSPSELMGQSSSSVRSFGNIAGQLPELASNHAHALTQNPSQALDGEALMFDHTSQQSIQPETPTNKRPPSSTKSSREKPPVPPKKRQKLDEFLASKDAYGSLGSTDPYADLGLAFDTPETSLQDSRMISLPKLNTRLLEGTTSRVTDLDVDMDTADGVTPSNIDNDADMDMGSTWSLRDDSSWITVQSAGDVAMSVLSSDSSTALRHYRSRHWTSKDHLVDQEPLRKREIDSRRPIDTFSKDEIDDMKLAADFLSGLGCEEDAFTLYILIYKIHSHCQATGNTPSQQSWVTSSAIIACATCAFTTPQIEIARNLLQQKLNEPQNSIPDVEKFLFRMLLAETYARVNDDATAKSHIELAMNLDLFDEDGLLHSLPRKNRSFDILTYHYLADGLGYRTLLRDASYYDDIAHRLSFEYGFTHRVDSDSSFSAQELLFIDEWEAWGQLMRQAPGPFEVQNESMRNPCLRSCLEWCIDELRCRPTLSQTWDLVKSNRDTLERAEMIAIYCCLWERWQNHKGPDHLDSLLWAEQAECLMGITAAELLKTICSMIVSASPHHSGQSEQILVRRALHGAKILSEHPDEILGGFFLDRFSCLRTFFNASQKHVVFEHARQTYGKDFIEKKLRIKLPDVITRVLQNPRHSFDVAAAFLPTLASSMHSSELASFRTLRDKAKIAREVVFEVANTLPSSVLKRASESTLPSMSDLSAMTSNLSLSSFQQARSSAVNLVQERVVAIEGAVRRMIE